ncbi:MAG: LysR substrate-binding domain-containing protein [Sphingobium sp.]|nr:LysR substrate-binding domain-containing protein [Sphingobium sp.]
MNIRQLRYFLAVAQELNFTRAAEKIGIAQPPLSQQILALEQELGTALFTRDKRRIRLTAAGEILVDHAHRVINAASAAENAVRLVERGARANITVGAIYTAIYSFLPKLLRHFNAMAPNVEVSLREMTLAQQIVGLNEGVIEIGLLRGPIHQRDLRTEILYREQLVVAIPSTQADEFGDPVSIREISRHPLVAVARGSSRSYSDRVLDVFDSHDLEPMIAHEVSDMHTAVCLVAAGMGISIVPAIIQTMQTKGVVYRRLLEETNGVTFAVALRRDTDSPIVDMFLKAARSSAQEMLAEHSFLFSRRSDG